MTIANDEAKPAKCTHCNKPMQKPLVCDFCHSLNPTPSVTDYFTLLGLERKFQLADDELHKKFIAASRYVHPDFHGSAPEESQELALRLSAAINDAYRTLKDPATRAAYLLELLGGKSSADDKSVPEDFLDTTMMMQEELADAKADNNTAVLDRLRGVLSNQQAGLLSRIANLFGEYQEGAVCAAVRNDLLDEIRKSLNAVSYVKKLLMQL